MTDKHESYDLEAIYDRDIHPLMEQIIKVCKEHKIPMVSTFEYKYDAEEDRHDLCTTRIYFPERYETDNLSDATKIIYRKPQLLACTITAVNGGKS